MMIPAGGETSASRDRRLMNDAMSAAGRSLSISINTRRRDIENLRRC
jgi:hypothetical protein